METNEKLRIARQAFDDARAHLQAMMLVGDDQELRAALRFRRTARLKFETERSKQDRGES